MDINRLKKRGIEISIVVIFAAVVIGVAVFMHPSEKVMGILQMDSYKYEESERRLLEAHEKNPNDIITIKSLIELYYRWGKRDAYYEIQYYKKYIALRPRDTAMRKSLARAYSWEKMPEKAVEQYEAILEYDPDNIGILRSLAGTYAWHQQHKKAIDCLLAIHKQNKFVVEDYRNIVRYYIASDMGKEGLQEAIKFNGLFRKKHRKDFNSNDYIHLMNLNLWLGQKEKAFALMDMLINTYSRSIDVKMTCIDWLMQIDEESLALRKVQEWLERTPDNMELLENSVTIYLKMENQQDRVIEMFERIMKHPDARDLHHLQYYWILIDRKLDAKAYAKGKEFSDELKTEKGLWSSYADICQNLKLYDEALVAWDKVLKQYPEDEIAHENKFNVLKILKRENEAFVELSWLLKRKPESHQYIKYAIDYYVLIKDYDKVFRWAKKGASLDEDDKYYSEMLLDCARKSGDKNEAIKMLLSLLEHDPKQLKYREGLFDIYLQLKDNANAIKTLDQIWVTVDKQKPLLDKYVKMYAWIPHYQTQLKRFIELEDLEPGNQYFEEIYKCSIYTKDIKVAREILENKVIEGEGLTTKHIEQLFALYDIAELKKERLIILDNKNVISLFGEAETLKKKAKILLELGGTREYILVVMRLYDQFESDQPKWRKDILQKVSWLKDKGFQKIILAKYAKHSLAYAYLLIEDKKFKEAIVILQKFEGSAEEELKKNELILSCQYESKDSEGVLKTLEYLSKHTKDDKKNAIYLSQQASLYHEKGEIEKALHNATQSLKRNPENIQARVIQGYAFYDLRRYPEAAEALKKSGSKETYPRFLLGASLYRFASGRREGERVFNTLLREYEKKHTFYKWDLVLNIGYEMKSHYLKERAFYNLVTFFCDDKKRYAQVMPRYALHLMYTGRRIRAEKVFLAIEPTDKANYIACQRVFEPQKFKGNLSHNEKLALADFSERSGDWFQATQWLP